MSAGKGLSLPWRQAGNCDDRAPPTENETVMAVRYHAVMAIFGTIITESRTTAHLVFGPGRQTVMDIAVRFAQMSLFFGCKKQ